MKLSTTIQFSPQEVEEALKQYTASKFPKFGTMEGATFARADDGTMEVRFDMDMTSVTSLVPSVAKDIIKKGNKDDGKASKEQAIASLAALPNPAPGTLLTMPRKAQDASSGSLGAVTPEKAESAPEAEESLFSGGELPAPNSGIESKPVSTPVAPKVPAAAPGTPAKEDDLFDVFNNISAGQTPPK
jgi:hypothetical protein